jgi:hypothetical protein
VTAPTTRMRSEVTISQLQVGPIDPDDPQIVLGGADVPMTPVELLQLADRLQWFAHTVMGSAQ